MSIFWLGGNIRKNVRMRVLIFIAFLGIAVFLRAQKISSPTGLEIFRFLEKGDQSFLQPAASGTFKSAMFGMVRNEGTRFHEGIDIKSVSKMGNGRPQDLVYAVYEGKVAYISRENNGSYGRYVVLTHKKDGFEFYSLYAHLFTISASLCEGCAVGQGTILGIIGQTSTAYRIPVDSAHLHFEIGMVLGGKGFGVWYSKNYGEGNLHGIYNGLNLVGFDPIGFYSFHKDRKDFDPTNWMKSMRKAFSLTYHGASCPDLIFRSPKLFFGENPRECSDWEIDFTWYGFPICFRKAKANSANLRISNTDEGECILAEKRGMLVRSSSGWIPGKKLRDYMEILFNSSFKND